MSLSIKIQRAEIARFARKVKKWEAALKKEVADDFAEAAINIDRNAKLRAPVNTLVGAGGVLRSGQYFEKRKGGLNYLIGNRVKYAPYQEFGTGRRVSLVELVKAGYPSSYALQFKGKGIREVNIQPQPFLFPSVNEEVPKTYKRLRETFKRHGKKF